MANSTFRGSFILQRIADAYSLCCMASMDFATPSYKWAQRGLSIFIWSLVWERGRPCPSFQKWVCKVNTLVSLSLKLGLVQSTLRTFSMPLPSSEAKSLMWLHFPFWKREKCRKKMLLTAAAATQHNTTDAPIYMFQLQGPISPFTFQGKWDCFCKKDIFVELMLHMFELFPKRCIPHCFKHSESSLRGEAHEPFPGRVVCLCLGSSSVLGFLITQQLEWGFELAWNDTVYFV